MQVKQSHHCGRGGHSKFNGEFGQYQHRCFHQLR
jgi:hypothetical protein